MIIDTDNIVDIDARLDLAKQLRDRSDFDGALTIYREVLAGALERGETLLTADMRCDIGGLLCFMDPNAAYEPLQQAMNDYEQIGNRSRIARAHGRLANLHRIQGRIELALEHYHQGMKIFREDDEPEQLLILLGNLAGFLYEYQHPEEAENYIKEAIDLARVAKDRDKEAWYLTMYAKELQLAGKDELATNKIDHALRLAESLSDTHLLASVREGKAFIHLMRREYDSALVILSYLLNYFEKSGDVRYLASIHISTAECLRQMGRLDESLEHYTKALALVKKIEDLRGETNVVEGIAEVYYIKGDFEKAYHNFHQAAATYRNLGEMVQVGIVHNRIALVCRDMSNPAEAKASYESALSIFRRKKETHLLAITLFLFADLMIDDGQYSYANELLTDASDSLNWEKAQTYALDCMIPLIRIGYLSETGRIDKTLTLPPLAKEWRVTARKALELINRFHIIPSDRSVRHFAALRTELLVAGIPEKEVPQL